MDALSANKLFKNKTEPTINRGSWIALFIATFFLVYQLFPEITNYLMPSDGWSLDVEPVGGDFSNLQISFKTHMVDGDTPLQAKDILIAVEGQTIKEIASKFATFTPKRPANWEFGQSVRYTIQRGEQTLDVEVRLVPLTVQSFFRHALENWQSPWLALFMFLFFMPAMVFTGIIVFFRQPRMLSAQALLIVSIAFIGQLSYSPFGVINLLFWPFTLPYAFLAERWTSVIFPTIFLFGVSFPRPKGPLRHRLGFSLALIYLPWFLGSWGIIAAQYGNVGGIYSSWSVLFMLQLILIVVLIGSLIHSFRTVHGAIERAQLKWFTIGLLGFIFAGGISWIIGSVLNLSIFNSLINYFGYLFLPLCLAIAILRYRLFDIDLIIRRTVQYLLLSGLLGLAYFGSVILLRQLLGGISGESSISIVLSTLLIATLFEPVRRKVQAFIDRAFFRQKYDAARAIEAFNHAARQQVELPALTSNLAQVVEETIQPVQVSLWLKEGKH